MTIKTIIIKNLDTVDHTYAGQLIGDGESYTIQSETERLRFAADTLLNQHIWAGTPLASIGDGVIEMTGASADAYLKLIDPSKSNTDGRKIGHSTPRKYGSITYFTGAGDDPANEYAIGGANGQKLTWHHSVSDPMSETVIVDFNSIENETYIHAGMLQWKDALNDDVTCEIIPKVTAYSTGTGFDYTLYGGYLIVPTAPTAGDVDVAANDRALVEVPISETGNRMGAGYFDADWNVTTKLWENFAPNYSGTGRFNMFTVPVVLDRFTNRLPVLGSGMSPLGTHDASMFGHNNRAKFTINTNGTDHEWWGNCWFVLHRKKTA